MVITGWDIAFGLIFAFLAVFSGRKKFGSCRQRTYLNFTANKEIWSNVERWAKREGCKLESQSEIERLYRKGSRYLLIHQNDENVHIEAWIKFDMLFSKHEIAVDEATLLCSPYQIKDMMRINTLLATLGSSVRVREFCRRRARFEIFASNNRIWGNVERWAKKEGYKLKHHSKMERIYKKWSFLRDKSPFWNPPFDGSLSSTAAYCLIRQDRDKIYIEAWIEARIFWGFKQEIAADEEDIFDRIGIGKESWGENMVRINNLLVVLGNSAMRKEA